MMEVINGIALKDFPIKNIRKVSDLIYFQGPLISHYSNISGDNFLFYWVDNDDDLNRWLVLRISSTKLNEYVNKRITLLDLIQNPADGFIYSIDIDDNVNYTNPRMLLVGEIPAKYFPKENSFYEFSPVSSEAIIDELLDRSNQGILQASFKNSTKVGYGTIHLDVFSPTVHHINEITNGVGNSFFKHKQKYQIPDEKGKKPKLNKTEFLYNTQFEVAGMAAGSFKLFLKPISKQVVLQGEKSEIDNYCDYLLDFIEASYDYDKLLEFVNKVDAQVINHYEKLLLNIQDFKLDFELKWFNKNSNTFISKVIDYNSAPKIIENLNRLEYQNSEDLNLTGRFLELNLKTNHFTFLSVGEDKLECKGNFDKLIKDGIVKVAFNKLYDVKIKRSESKEAGKKKSSVKDLLTSFIEQANE